MLPKPYLENFCLLLYNQRAILVELQQTAIISESFYFFEILIVMFNILVLYKGIIPFIVLF